MMIRPLSQAGNAAAIAALTLALTACGRAPYPTPTPEPPPPPPPTADLMGEPLPPPLEAPALDQEYAGPPPAPEPYPAPQPYPAPEPYYAEAAPVEPPPAPPPPVIIAMAPIPNPPEPGALDAPPVRREPPVRRAEVQPARPAPAARAERPASQAAPARPAVRQPAPAPTEAPAVKAAPPSDTARITPPAPVIKPGAPAVPPLKTPARPSAGAAGGGASPLGERSTRLAALETALTEAVGRQAKLNTPQRFTVNQPAEVTLTLPPEFAQMVKDEAARNDLADAAASVNVTAVLSGEGYAVTPSTAQARPLAAGQPVEFRWAVTPQPGRRGPLIADVGADLLGAGADTLSLGSVRATTTGIGGVSNRIWGLFLLALIAGLVVAFLARGRRPSPTARVRREPRPTV